jgi:hypothetical protein
MDYVGAGAAMFKGVNLDPGSEIVMACRMPGAVDTQSPLKPGGSGYQATVNGSNILKHR